jgi:chromosome segregation ATPase
MQKFKSLNLTYERLVKEVEMLTLKSIEWNSEYNTINTKVKDIKQEYETIKLKIQEDLFKWKSDIVNFNKNYTKELEDKNIHLDKLETELGEQKNNLVKLNLNIEKKKLGVSNKESELNALQSNLGSKSINLTKKDKELSKKADKIKKEQEKWDIDIKYKKKISSELNKDIQEIRKEENKSKQDYDLRIQEINQQKKVLEIWEQRLKDKEEKINSEMKTLISAKSLINKK